MKQDWILILLAVILVGSVFSIFTDDDDDDVTRGDRTEIKTCPDYLEVAGPYRRGIDIRYDPRMDWDDDGVSCE